MKKILFILLLTTPFVGFGQSWEKTFWGIGNDEGYSVSCLFFIKERKD